MRSALYRMLAQNLISRKNSLTAHGSTYIELIVRNKNECPRLKTCTETDNRSKKCPKLSKTAKIGTLSLVSRVTRAPIIEPLMFVTKNSVGSYYQTRFHEEISKSRQDILKNLESHRFLVYHPSNEGHVTGPRADKASKIVLKVV